MSVCPWCKQPVAKAGEVCPACGNNPADHPSIQSAGYATFDTFDDFADGADPLSVESVQAPQRPPPSFGSLQDGDMPSGGDAAALSLDLSGSPAAPRAAPSDIRPAVRSPLEQPELPRIDPYEVAVFADYGQAPAQLWRLPAYAWRVMSRRRELRRALRSAQALAAAAERARDDRLVEVGEGARGGAAADPELSPLLAPIVEIEQLLREREQARAASNADFAQAVGGLDTNIAAETASAAALRTEAAAARADLDSKLQVLSRAQAAAKRAEIELRNAQDLARQAAGPEAQHATPEHADRIVALQRTLEQRRTELAQPQTLASEARVATEALDARVAEIERRVSSLRAQRRGQEQAFAREAGLRGEGVERAQADRRAALLALGARLVETGSPHVEPGSLEAFSQARDALAARALEVERTLRAIDACDPKAVQRGWAVLAAAVVVALALLAVLIAAFGRSGG
jgi:hypothetical protein